MLVSANEMKGLMNSTERVFALNWRFEPTFWRNDFISTQFSEKSPILGLICLKNPISERFVPIDFGSLQLEDFLFKLNLLLHERSFLFLEFIKRDGFIQIQVCKAGTVCRSHSQNGIRSQG